MPEEHTASYHAVGKGFPSTKLDSPSSSDKIDLPVVNGNDSAVIGEWSSGSAAPPYDGARQLCALKCVGVSDCDYWQLFQNATQGGTTQWVCELYKNTQSFVGGTSTEAAGCSGLCVDETTAAKGTVVIVDDNANDFTTAIAGVEGEKWDIDRTKHELIKTQPFGPQHGGGSQDVMEAPKNAATLCNLLCQHTTDCKLWQSKDLGSQSGGHDEFECSIYKFKNGVSQVLPPTIVDADYHCGDHL